MTGNPVASGMEVKRPRGWWLDFVEATDMDEPGDETNADQEQGKQHGIARCAALISRKMHESTDLFHGQSRQKVRALTLRNGRETCLQTPAYGCYSIRRTSGLQAETFGTDVLPARSPLCLNPWP